MDEFDLERFVTAQDSIFETALSEIRSGRKTGHWMWFIFPQIAGLGSSSNSQFFAIRSFAEARAYLAHPLLGPRLTLITKALQSVAGVTAGEVFGLVDAQKLQSSLTLFAAVVPGETTFAEALQRWFQGEYDQRTLDILASDES